MPALLGLVLCAVGPAQADQGRVTRVWDGDTISVTVDGQEVRVRLAGIDAPERDQPFGTEARQRLSTLVVGKDVRLEGDRKDVYGRRLAKVWVRPEDCPACGQTLDAGMGLLTVGLAWWYRHYRNDQSPEDQGRYEFAEFEAKAKKVGLWSDPDPVAPWDWPRGRSSQSAPTDGCRIKGNISANGRIYHLPGQRDYEATTISPGRGERWFCSEEEARDAGWRRAKR